jgi:Tfp pilus assembly protein PilF
MPLEHKLQTALAKHRSGDVAAAASIYRAILAEMPEQPDALHMLGIIAQQAGNSELALKLIEAALAKNPSFAQAWHNRCLVLRKLGRPDEALQSAREATALDPTLAEAWDMAGSILREKRQFAEASSCLERAVKLRPDNAQILNSYAVLLTAMGQLKEAWSIIKRMSSFDDVSSFMGRGNIFKAAGRPERAIPWFQKAYEIKPDFTGARLNEAMAWLQMGDGTEGWPLWEQRLEDEEHKPLPAPQWKGEPVKHLLLREDQGMGDALQCLRYLPFIRDRADKVTLQLTGILQKLLAPNLAGISLITQDDPTPEADAAAQLMSLPAICGTAIDTIPGAVPYIRAEEAWRAPWRERLASIPKPRIGLVWGGNPGNRHEFNRSLPFSALAPIVQSAPGHFVSLQKGPQRHAAELAAAGVFDADSHLDNFTATAGLMAELDLVITICSSPAHLAGAMGRPTWTMLCFDPHWVWLLGREDSPWYPSMRLFRQKTPQDWSPVVSIVAEEVRKFIRGDQSVLTPKRWTGPPLRQNPLAIELPD